MQRKERPSLVDGAEQALRAWLAPGRYRPGDRLPPEHELAAMLGISRGTLRSALQRLEKTEEIDRRQGSGTYVAKTAAPRSYGEQLQRLEGYSAYARRRGVEITATHMRIGLRAVGREAAEHLEIDARDRATVVSRVLLAERVPVAAMHDNFHPSVVLPPADDLRERLRDGDTIFDLLHASEITISFARTLISPILVDPEDQLGRRLKVSEPTACLELSEVMYAGGEEAVLYSRDVFTPDGIDIELVRSVDAPHPAPVSLAHDGGHGRGARRAPVDP